MDKQRYREEQLKRKPRWAVTGLMASVAIAGVALVWGEGERAKDSAKFAGATALFAPEAVGHTLAEGARQVDDGLNAITKGSLPKDGTKYLQDMKEETGLEVVNPPLGMEPHETNSSRDGLAPHVLSDGRIVTFQKPRG